MAKNLKGKNLPKGIRQKKDGRYEGRIREMGEDITLYDYNLKNLVKKMEEKRYQIHHGVYCKPSDETISSWFETWITEYKQNSIKKSTLQTYKQVYREFIDPVMGKKKLMDVTSQAIQKLINDLYEEDYSKGRINMAYVILYGMFKQAQKNGILLKNPMDAVSMPKFQKVRQEDRRVMTVEEQNLFLKMAAESNSVYYDFYEIALSTGMRINEILALRWSDINFEKKEISVNGTLFYERGGGKARTIEPPKTECSRRTIPMLPNVEKLLRTRRKAQMENKMRLGPSWKEEKGLENMVMTYEAGGVFWDSGIRVDMKNIIAEIQKDRDFEPITPHTFRHTFATRCVENGVPLQVLKTILGHSSLAMTADLYSHVLPDTKQEEMLKIANLF